jgi:Lauroyl/myristoyl acyltransferase
VDVTRENLSLAFPEKTDSDRQKIMNAYYKNLCDSIVETIKLMSISEKKLSNRIHANWEALDIMDIQNRNGQGLVSHQFHWEWGTVICNWKIKRLFCGIYLPLTNSHFDRLMYYIRSRSGTKLIRVQDMQKSMNDIQKQKILWGFIADQNPSDPKRVSWNDFFNRKTAFFKGPELVARRNDNIVFFVETIKLKRGYYEMKIKPAFEHPRETSDGEITEAYVRFLEDSIKRQPENWVWSHRKWKHVQSA